MQLIETELSRFISDLDATFLKSTIFPMKSYYYQNRFFLHEPFEALFGKIITIIDVISNKVENYVNMKEAKIILN
ncbi:hypothetical protein AHMF7605_10110 [Adhaeribacter arboris]|uniref:Uncharacterized protein n=1 Tax=Adhaeribacter arboris TaxID=2072846 RepID=A0A2T2YEA7_9BACT|nr:hypothetical protein AHMF7605_10110 [Adhaeribacter arboris]